MATEEKALSAGDAVRLLSNALHKIHHLELTGEGTSPLCKTRGELVLQDALQYLAYGDTEAARGLIDIYEEWLRTGEVPWPFDGKPPP